MKEDEEKGGKKGEAGKSRRNDEVGWLAGFVFDGANWNLGK